MYICEQLQSSNGTELSTHLVFHRGVADGVNGRPVDGGRIDANPVRAGWRRDVIPRYVDPVP